MDVIQLIILGLLQTYYGNINMGILYIYNINMRNLFCLKVFDSDGFGNNHTDNHQLIGDFMGIDQHLEVT